jgi:hypothetical protein
LGWFRCANVQPQHAASTVLLKLKLKEAPTAAKIALKTWFAHLRHPL